MDVTRTKRRTSDPTEAFEASAEPEILFVYPRTSRRRTFDGFDYHLGAGYIRAYLADRGIVTAQFIHDGRARLEEIAEQIAAHHAPLVGFSCYDSNYYLTRLLATVVRQRSPETTIVCGGPAPTFSDRLILDDCPAIDICARFYGEETAVALCEWAHGRRTLDAISGISYRSAGRVAQTPCKLNASSTASGTGSGAGNGNACLDAFPDPYLAGMIPADRVSSIGIVTSRGCNHACTYCSCSAMSARRVRYHSVDRVLAVLRYLECQLGTRPEAKAIVPFLDDNFSMNRQRLHRLLTRLAAEGLGHLAFWAEMRAEALDDESFDLLRQAGFFEVHFGLESAVPRVLATLKKVRARGGEQDGYRAEQRFVDAVARGVERANRAGLATSVSVMFGCPGESIEDGRRTLAFVEQLGVTRYSHNLLRIPAGTELARTYGQYGLRMPHVPGKPLPRKTLHAYDVLQLPVLDHDVGLAPRRSADLADALRLIRGLPEPSVRSGAAFPGSSARRRPLLALRGRARNAAALTWLRSEMPLAAGLWLIYRDPVEPDALQEPLVECGVPVQEANTLRSEATRDGHVVYWINEESLVAPAANTRKLRCVPLCGYPWQAAPSCVTDTRTCLALTIETQADIDALIGLAHHGRKAGTWPLGPAALDAGMSFADECRWSSSACPAASGERFFVDEDGSLRPCAYGAPIGHVGERFEVVRDRLRSLAASRRRERGCDTCRANRLCSRCLFPHPVSVERYCQIRVQEPGIADLVDGVRWSRALHTNMPAAVREGCAVLPLHHLGSAKVELNGITVEAADCVALLGNRTASGYLVDRQQSRLLRLDPITRAVITRLDCFSDESRTQD